MYMYGLVLVRVHIAVIIIAKIVSDIVSNKPPVVRCGEASGAASSPDP